MTSTQPTEPAGPTDRGILGLTGTAGLVALALGLAALQPTRDFGWDPTATLPGILGELTVTGPAAVLMLAATALHLLSAATLVRGLAGRPASGMGEATLSAFAMAVFRDAALLGILGSAGLFRAPVLLGLDAAELVVAWRKGWVEDLVVAGSGPTSGTVRSWASVAAPFAVLVGIVWAAPVLLQLGSPVVPFIDVLPNHVAPAEHLRTFGSFDPLSATQSPIYGPSRTFLGYVALLGALTSMTGLPAGLALAAFAIPSGLLLALGAVRMTRAFGAASAGPWVLLLLGTTTAFARLGDARATVVVLPIVAWLVASITERLAAPVDEGPNDGVLLGIGLGAALLVHPAIGALAALALAALVALRPDRLAAVGVPALAVGALAAVPQAATMLGVSLPATVLTLSVATALVVGLRLAGLPELLGPLARLVRWLVLIAAAVAIGGAVVLAPAAASTSTPAGLDAARDAVLGFVFSAPVALAVIAAGLLAGSRALRSPVLGVLFAVPLVVAALVALIPDDGGMLALSLRFELPKTLHYWLPLPLAVGAALGLDAIARRADLARTARVLVLGAIVVFAAVPLRVGPIDPFHLGERRLAEVVGLDARYAGQGFWSGYPDSRSVVDGPRRELLAMVRARIAAGRIGPSTPLLHVAKSFQQWSSTPFGVFDGVTESIVAEDSSISIHTVGGRLRTFGELPALLASREYPYLVLEPRDLDPAIREAILAAGYVRLEGNAQGELFHLGPEAAPAP